MINDRYQDELKSIFITVMCLVSRSCVVIIRLFEYLISNRSSSSDLIWTDQYLQVIFTPPSVKQLTDLSLIWTANQHTWGRWLSAWSITHSWWGLWMETDPGKRMWSEWTLLMLRHTEQRTTRESDSYTWGPSQVIMGCANDDVTLLDCEWAAG